MKRGALFLFLGAMGIAFLISPVFSVKVFSADTPPDLKASSDTLDFGHDGIEKTLYLTNAGTKDLFWSLKTETPWLKVDPMVGKIGNFTGISPNVPYYFSNMWPKLPQPWYFVFPMSVGIDHEGSIYVVDYEKNRVTKFNKYEEFLFEIGSDDIVKDDYLYFPTDITFDSQDNFYVINGAAGVKKFNKNGNYMARIVMKTIVEKNSPYAGDIAIDSKDNIYITDIQQSCVQKFDRNGNYLKSWGSRGSSILADGELWGGTIGIIIDSKDYVYVADNHYHRIQKFDTDGTFIKMWAVNTTEPRQPVTDDQAGAAFVIDSKDIIYVGHEHSGGISQFDTDGNKLSKFIPYPSPYDDYHVSGNYYLRDASVDKNGNVYIVSPNPCIIKYDSQGKIVAYWKKSSSQNGMFGNSGHMKVMDKKRNIYVKDSSSYEQNRMQIFDAYGKLINIIDLSSQKYSQYQNDIARSEEFVKDSVGNIYFVPFIGTSFIRFDVNGNFIEKREFVKLNRIYAIAIDSKDNVYIEGLPKENEFVFLQKLDKDGNLIMEWDSRNFGYKNSIAGYKLAIDFNDNVFVSVYNGSMKELMKFDANGSLIKKWAQPEEVAISAVEGIDVDSKGYIYTLAAGKLKKFDAAGQLLGLIIDQELNKGVRENEFSHIQDFKIGLQDNIYLFDDINCRVQVFSQLAQPVKVSVDRSKLTAITNQGSLSFYNDGDAFQPPVSLQVSVKTKELLSAIGDKIVDEGKLLSFPILSAEGIDSKTLTYSVSNLPSGATFDPGNRTFSWTPGFTQAGGYYVTFAATDGKITDQQTIFIVVNNVNQPPKFNPIGNKTIDKGKLLSFPISATDVDGDVLTYSASGLPSGATFNPSTRTFSWTPGNNQVGKYPVTFKVSDGNLSDSQAITITVNDIAVRVNSAPEAKIIAHPTIGRAPLRVQFQGDTSIDHDGRIVSYLWNFGDGSTSPEVNPLHTFKNSSWLVPKSYKVTLTVVDNDGAKSSAYVFIIVYPFRIFF